MTDSPTTVPDAVPATVPELIDAFGGNSAFARVIGKGASTAGEQRRSGRLPVEYWDLVISAAKTADIPGVSYESLAKMHIPSERRVESGASACR